ncbi:MAG: DJ-1/PfpI family protein [Zetaproteobacteria bacterium]|nr:MAG: DJ-1/PfpI family protein [Zetaproteobacteria bacterium]
MATALVPFSEGVEELEMISVVDLLRRAGVEVTTATLDGAPAKGRSGIVIQPDAALDDVLHQDWDAVVLPGGLPNAFTLRDDPRIENLLRRQVAEGRVAAAICAAPAALARAGVLANKCATSYPACREDVLREDATVKYLDEPVVVDGLVVTSRGPGTAIPFALALIRLLVGENRAEEVAREIVYSA